MSKFQLIENCAAEKTVIVVAGTGQGAVAALGEVLLRLGCDAPASAGEGRTSKIAELNNAVLESSGTSKNDWVGFDSRWLASPKAAEFLVRALEVLEEEFSGSYLSVIQDSGTALLLPFWNIVFDRAGIVPRYVLVINGPEDLAGELRERLGIEARTAHLVWLRAALDGEANSRGKLRSFVDSAQLSSDPAAAVKFLAKSLQITFPRDARRAFTSGNFRLEKFQSFVGVWEAGAANPSSVSLAADWVSATHQILHDWAANGETSEGRTVLDAIREAFDEAVPAFAGIGSAAQGKANGFEVPADLESQIEELRRAKAESDEAFDEAQEQLQARYSEIVTLTRMLATETAAARKYERSANRLQGIAQALERGGVARGSGQWFRRLLPWSWHLPRVQRSIQRQGLFDGRAYLAANPDVENAGIDPLRHYLAHGVSEGRPLGTD